MRYSLVTPTILRPSLATLCASIDGQTSNDWEHLIIVDTDVPNDALLEGVKHAQRFIHHCSRPHHDFGHSCRHEAWPRMKGEYVWYLDDDNYVADENALRDLEFVTGPWAIFPILRHGSRFFADPPGMGGTDTGSFIVRREFAEWPASSSYSADGDYVEALKRSHPYQSLSAMRPLMVMPVSSMGR